MKSIFSYFFLLMVMGLHAQILENQYNAYSIPDSLRKDATIVMRKHHVEYVIKKVGQAIQKEHLIVTLLKPGNRSDQYATRAISYDKQHKITNLEAFIYDAFGKLVQQLKKKDITDHKKFEAWVDDVRYKVLNFPRLTYPYTIEYKVIYEIDGTLFYPHFEPQEHEDIAVQDASLNITVLAGNKLRYKEIGISNNDKVSVAGDTYSWRFQNIKAFKEPSFAPNLDRYSPSIITAPSEFSMGDYAGNMNTWNDYGNFMYRLNQGRQNLPPQTIDVIKKLVANCPDTACIIERIYTHLQNTTRYFSIQLGIGGWQTIPATDVDVRKYGDCKALSNYMVSMLAAVGVKAYSADIRANNPTQYEDFPNAIFNHVIACVPMQQDTIWLECTSQEKSCGFLGSGTDNRLAILVTEEGGKAVHTPIYDEKVNIIRKNTTVWLDSLGNAAVEANNQYAAIAAEYMDIMATIDADTRKKYFYKYLSINQFELKKLHYERHKKRIPVLNESFELSVEKLASVNGKRLFLPLNLFSVWDAVPSGDSTRQHEVQANDRGFTQIDSVSFHIPAGFKVESKYAPILLENEFGSYEMRVTNENNKILFYRKIVLNNKIFPKEKFIILNDFLRQVIKADKSKLVLVKVG